MYGGTDYQEILGQGLLDNADFIQGDEVLFTGEYIEDGSFDGYSDESLTLPKFSTISIELLNRGYTYDETYVNSDNSTNDYTAEKPDSEGYDITRETRVMGEDELEESIKKKETTEAKDSGVLSKLSNGNGNYKSISTGDELEKFARDSNNIGKTVKINSFVLFILPDGYTLSTGFEGSAGAISFECIGKGQEIVFNGDDVVFTGTYGGVDSTNKPYFYTVDIEAK